MKSPDVPTKLPVVNGKTDSTYIGRYMKEHYWDDVAFNDDRILHTPIFDPKLDNYIKYYVSPDPDSIFNEINYMLLYARTTKEMFHYLLGRFTDKYINPEIMGQDKVFASLFENYFAKGDTLWLNATQRKYIFDRYYSIIGSIIGKPASPLDLVDTAGKPVSLYEVKAPYTFVVFWDPTCSHCKEQVPEVDSMYEAKWKKEGVKVFAVNVNEATMGEWKTFIRDQHLAGWIHAWQTKEDHEADTRAQRPNFRQMYDVFQTPTMYLLDEQKHIIAKRLSLQQFDGIIDMKLKNPNASK
jgi:thiol-disulfide isomerase/thioredoxin